jgi:DNA-binding beta-propeller fold protein YncE
MTNTRKLVAIAAVLALIAESVSGQGAGKAPAKELRAQGTGARAQGGRQAPQFEVDYRWPQPMPDHRLLGSVTGLAIDAQDHVWVVNITTSFTTRTETGADQTPPIGECCYPSPNVLRFDPQGKIVAQWGGPGQGYDWPSVNSGLALDGAGNVWIAGTDGLDAHIVVFARDGKFVRQIGKPGTIPPPAAPTDTAFAGAGAGRAAGAAAAGRGGRGGRGRGAPAPSMPPNSNSADSFGGAVRVAIDTKAGEAYVADGVRNRRVAVVDVNTGVIKRYWGAYGERPDDAPLPPYDPAAMPARQFRTVSCAVPSNDGMIYVCDRGNNRVQVFRKDGSFVREARVAPQTRGEGSVWDIALSRDQAQRWLYVADGSNMKVHILERASLEEVASFGDGGKQPGQFLSLHSIAVDSRGNLFTAETNEGKRVQKFVYRGLGPAKLNAGVLWPKRSGR